MMLLIYMMVIHFIADFLLQSREMGKNKSTKFTVLLQHIGIQFAMFLILLMPFVGFKFAYAFALFNAIIHGVIDWNIWRLYKLSVLKRLYDDEGNDYIPNVSKTGPNHSLMSDSKVWQYQEDHWFYATIGLDQLLHAITIIALFGILFI